MHLSRRIAVAACCLLFAACGATKEIEIPTAAERFMFGMKEYHSENWFDAIQHFEVIRLQYPGSAQADSARFYTGMCRYKRGEYILASYDFNQLVANFPSSGLLIDAQYMFAECYDKLSPEPALDQVYTVRAIDAYQTFIELYPTSPKVQDAEKRILALTSKLAEKELNTGILYTRLENYSSALIYFDTVIDRYYNTEFVDDAMVQKLRILMRRKKYDDVSAISRTFLAKFPDSPYKDEVKKMQEQIAVTGPSAGMGK
jgi:outer membrane protein assembly factor BamD